MTEVSTPILQKVYDESLTITRNKYKNGFRFYSATGKHITDISILKRLRKLVIPPMWSEVRVCKWENGHIQAIGRDLKGRKQYIYHSEWERLREEAKFAKMFEFGENLSNMRVRAKEDIAIKKWTKCKMAALLVMILDETGIRIGNRQYAERNGTYGLTTLRRKHLNIDEGILLFEYKGKSNKLREVVIDDQELIKHIKKSSSLPGYELFRYRSGTNQFQPIDSDDVNAYIRKTMGDQFSSKDFRTWVATRLAIELYPEALDIHLKSPRRKFANILVKLVADELGNTPTVCRSHYIHPQIMGLVEMKKIPECNKQLLANSESELNEAEILLLRLLQGEAN